MKKDFTPTSKELRDWADNPAASRMVPVSPTSLRAVADLLDAQEAEIATLRTSLAATRDCFPAPAAGSAREDAWAEAMSAPECVAAYVVACVADKDAEIAALREDALRYRDLREAAVYGLPSCEGGSKKHAFLVITGYGDDESADLTDQAVDEAIAQAVQQ